MWLVMMIERMISFFGTLSGAGGVYDYPVQYKMGVFTILVSSIVAASFSRILFMYMYNHLCINHLQMMWFG
jgi:energy-converting hydrogenase Eha subunit F